MAWKQHPTAKTLSPECKLTVEDVESVIRARNKARRSRNFNLADKLLGELTLNGVSLDDKKKLWRADGEQCDDASIETYEKAPNSKPISEEEEAHVCEKLEERSAAKQRKDYDAADELLDELRFLMNVAVDDKKKTWRVTEPFKTMYTYGGQRMQNVPKDSLRQIEQLVRDRSDAKKEKNFRRADEILEDLRIHFGVRVDDNKKAWYFIQKTKEERAAMIKDKVGGKKKMDRNSKNKKADKVSDWSVLKVDAAMPEGVSPKDGPDAIPEGVAIECSDDQKRASERQNKSDMEALTIPQLKDKLREAGLPVSGRKAELVDRLMVDE